MTHIPEMYLAEAVRRLNAEWGHPGYYKLDKAHFREVRVLARTLQELGWTPPIDEARMAKARKVAAAVLEGWGVPKTAEYIRNDSGHMENADYAAIQAAYDALGED